MPSSLFIYILFIVIVLLLKFKNKYTVKLFYFVINRIGGVEEMIRIGLYMNDLGLHDTSHEMALSGIKPLPQLEMARDHVCWKQF